MEVTPTIEEAIKNWGIPLPLHIIVVIFSKLSISNYPLCRLVSKSWNRIVIEHVATAFSNPIQPTVIFSTRDEGNSKYIPYLNPKIHCFDLRTLNFAASCTIHGPDVQSIALYNYCNGLLFIEKGNFDVFCEGIFNPMTHEFFPTPIADYGLYTGFGFNPRTNQYKLFVARSGCETKVLRFGQNNNQWNSVYMPSHVNVHSDGVYVNGFVYYLGKKQENDYDYIIYALDVDTENFEVIAALEVGSYSYGGSLCQFNGTIYVIVFMASQVQLWKMKRKDLWVRDFIVPGKFGGSSFNLLKSSEDGSIFLRIKNDLLWLNKSLPKRHIKTLIPCHRQFVGATFCLIESLHFGSLSDILAGHD